MVEVVGGARDDGGLRGCGGGTLLQLDAQPALQLTVTLNHHLHLPHHRRVLFLSCLL